jgi:Retrotransposon gag protein/Zinc knuckle
MTSTNKRTTGALPSKPGAPQQRDGVPAGTGAQGATARAQRLAARLAGAGAQDDSAAGASSDDDERKAEDQDNGEGEQQVDMHGAQEYGRDDASADGGNGRLGLHPAADAAERQQAHERGQQDTGRVRQLEEQLAQMQDMLSRLSAGGAWQRAGDAGRRGLHGGTAQAGAPETVARHATATAPKRLTYAAAQTTATLEDWLFEVETFCARVGITETAAHIAEARFAMDRDLWQWWSDYRKEAIRTHPGTEAQAARAIDTWDVFADAMREQFLAVNEQRLAIDAMCEVRQAGGEGMEAYFLRATQLYRKVHRAMDDRTIMRLVLARTRRDEWPYTYSKAITAVEAGAVTSLVQLRTLMTKEALTEPGKAGARATAQTQAQVALHSGAPGPGKSARPGSNRYGVKKRTAVAAASYAALERGDEEDGEEQSTADGDASASTRVNGTERRAEDGGGAPGGAREALGCFRCGAMDHYKRECPQAPKRSTGCFVCGKADAGHAPYKCPERKVPGSTRPSAGATSAPAKKTAAGPKNA